MAAAPPPPPPTSSMHRRVVSAVESYASYSSESEPCDDDTLPHRRASIRTLSDDDDDPRAAPSPPPRPLRAPDRTTPHLTPMLSLAARLDARLGVDDPRLALDTSFGIAEFAASSDSGSDSGYASSYNSGVGSASTASAAAPAAAAGAAAAAAPHAEFGDLDSPSTAPQASLVDFASASTSDASTSTTGISAGSRRRHTSYEDEGDDDIDDDDDDLLLNDTSCMPGGVLSPDDCAAAAAAKPPAAASKSSSSAVISTLKKRWRGVKRASVKGTTSAGKSLSSLSKKNFASSREPTETREDRHSRLGEEWLNSILPAWQKKRKTHRVRTLVFRGIPANVRRDVWKCAIGNPLNVSEQLFEVLKERACAGREEYLRHREQVKLSDGDEASSRTEPHMENERSAHKAISLDLPRTFPELSFFHAEGTHYEFALRDVLEAFLYLKPDIGYSQGMSFVAATLLLYMDPYEAFTCFVNMLLHKSCFLHFFRIQMPEVRFYLTVHERLLAEELPALYAHFLEHGVESNLYMINWVMSFYCRALPLDLVTRIWDLYVLDGDIAIFRAAIGLLRLFSAKLLKMKFEEMAYFLSHIPGEEIDPDELLQSIRSVRVVTRKRFKMLFKECQAEHKKSEQPPPAETEEKPAKTQVNKS